MTDEQIIKALECCGADLYSCCPFYDDESGCDCNLQFLALGLINRLKGENDTLKAMIEAAEDHYNPLPFKGIFDERISEAKAEAIREFAEKIDQLLNRYSHLHKYADKARESTEEYDDGTPIEMVSVYEVLSLEKWEMVDYETMSELQGNIETIAKERLLSELEKHFREIVKEMTEGQP